MGHAGFMFDTNVFNALLDDEAIAPTVFDGRKVFVTHVQPDELSATSNASRRQNLLKVFT